MHFLRESEKVGEAKPELKSTVPVRDFNTTLLATAGGLDRRDSEDGNLPSILYPSTWVKWPLYATPAMVEYPFFQQYVKYSPRQSSASGCISDLKFKVIRCMFCGYYRIKLESNNKNKPGKYPNIWKLNHTLLND